MKYETAYQCVMQGMRGEELTNPLEHESWYMYSAVSALDAIRTLEKMEPEETAWYTVGSLTGWEKHFDMRHAMKTAVTIHETQSPALFEVKRTGKGWQVETVWDSAA